MHNVHTRLIILLEIASMAALAVIFNTLTPIRMFWPTGGSVTLTAIPIAVVAFRRGVWAGTMCGLIAGFILLALPLAVRVHPLQMLLDYPLAFALLGLCGLVARKIKILIGRSKKSAIIIASVSLIFATFMRFMCHTLSGAIFFGQYTSIGQSKYIYSSLYNATYIIPELIISILVLSYVVFRQPSVLSPRQN